MGNKKKTFKCQECKYSSIRKYNLLRHKKLQHGEFKFRCRECPYKTKRKYCFDRHSIRHRKVLQERRVRNSEISCSLCKIQMQNKEKFDKHLDEVHKQKNQFEMVESTFRGQLRTYSRNLRLPASDSSVLMAIKKEFISLCHEILLRDFPHFTLNIIM